MAGRGGIAPTKIGLNTPWPPPPKHVKNCLGLPDKTKMFRYLSYKQTFLNLPKPIAGLMKTSFQKVKSRNIYYMSPRALKCSILDEEAVVRMYSVKKVFLEISQHSQENTYARASFLIKLQLFT